MWQNSLQNFTICNKNVFYLLFCSVFLTQLWISFCWICFPLVPTPPAFPSYMLIPLFFEPSLALSCKQIVYELNWGLAINHNKKKVQPFTLSKEKWQAQHWFTDQSFLPFYQCWRWSNRRFLSNFSLGSQHWYVSHFKLLSYHWRGFGSQD